jgi:hypothetical protein
MKVLQRADVQLAQEIIPLNEQKGGIGYTILTGAVVLSIIKQ